jgi:hypothetical protein
VKSKNEKKSEEAQKIVGGTTAPHKLSVCVGFCSQYKPRSCSESERFLKCAGGRKKAL